MTEREKAAHAIFRGGGGDMEREDGALVSMIDGETERRKIRSSASHWGGSPLSFVFFGDRVVTCCFISLGNWGVETN